MIYRNALLEPLLHVKGVRYASAYLREILTFIVVLRFGVIFLLLNFVLFTSFWYDYFCFPFCSIQGLKMVTSGLLNLYTIYTQFVWCEIWESSLKLLCKLSKMSGQRFYRNMYAAVGWGGGLWSSKEHSLEAYDVFCEVFLSFIKQKIHGGKKTKKLKSHLVGTTVLLLSF